MLTSALMEYIKVYNTLSHKLEEVYLLNYKHYNLISDLEKFSKSVAEYSLVGIKNME